MALQSPVDLAEGSPLALTSAGDVDTLVRAHGTRFLVTDNSGDIGPAGARELGLFADDTRYLSHYELAVRGLALVHLSSSVFDSAYNRVDLMVTGLGDEEFLDDPQNFLHVCRRQLVGDEEMRERIEVVNYLHRHVEVELVVSFDADYADVFEVRGAKRPRRGTLRAPKLAGDVVELGYEGLDGVSYGTRLSFRPAPASVGPIEAVFRLALEPSQAQAIDVTVAFVSSRVTTRRGGIATFESRANQQHASAAAFAEASTRFRCDNPVLEHVLAQSTSDLHALSVNMDDHRVLAAGIPWFCCPFGRDTLLAAYEALTLNPDLAAGSLRALAALQGEDFDAYTEEEPGKIFHELRSGEMAGTREIPHVPYYGTIDATPLFVVVAHHTYKVTADLELVSDLHRAIRRALSWIDRQTNDGTALAAYARRSPRGLDNQGWKDSRAGVSFPDGRRAEPPIALAEVQGYCVDAYRRGAELLRVVGDREAELYRARARSFAELVDRELWLEEEERYAFAVDGRGERLPTVVSNVGHLLWSRVAGEERARQTADLLVAPASLSSFGIRTLAAGQAVFNPLSYHNGTVWPHDNALVMKGFANYGLMDQACRVFEAMVAAMEQFRDRRLPELYCGMSGTDATLVRYPVACSPQAWAAAAPFLLVQAVLGIHIDGPAQQLVIRNPRMPRSVDRFWIEGLRVGGSRVSLRMRRAGKRCHVDRLDVSGEPLRTLVQID